MGLAIILLSVLGLYLLVDIGRSIKRQLPAEYRWQAVRHTAVWLLCLALLVLIITVAIELSSLSNLTLYYTVASLQLITALVVLASTLRHLRTTRPPDLASLADRDLPTLTVCIPARNETEYLDTCLQSLTTSTYPKLEILVLDDCSQDRRTPEIIRQFAHDGVRFIAGQVPPTDWLAKNFTYHQLAGEANGEILMFCGVDSQFQPDSLTNLIKTLLHKDKAMISLLPRNVLPSDFRRCLLQPARYAWELALPRRLLKRPPVLSTCWLIKRDTLKAAGGFGAVKRKNVPESYLAKLAASTHDGYSFLAADQTIGITSTKNFTEQKATATRTRYPQLHKRPEIVALVSLAEVAALLWPAILAGASVYYGHWALAFIAGAAYLLQTYAFVRIVNLAYRRVVPEGFLAFPFAAIYDICMLNYSMWQYEFGEVIWKDRNVCIPIMGVTDKLPPA
jgi:glycosyltransferase involved in cell wall biosynthesis